MKIVKTVTATCVLASIVSGCLTGGSVRDKVQEEYARLTSLPPAERVQAPDKAIDDLGRLSCDLFNEVHPLMKAYVAASENNREIVGFLNDVAVCVEEEKLSNEEAVKKVADAVKAEDANRSADQKVWPRVVEGLNALMALNPEKMLKDLAVFTVRNAQFIKSAAELKDSFKGFDATTLQKAAAAAKVSDQLTTTAECLAFLTEQFRRVQVLKLYQK